MPEPTPYLSQCLGERTRARVVSVENRMAIILKKKGEGNGGRNREKKEETEGPGSPNT
jgi:hypothetical protein|tara:strand:+ start:451 stop:624 length:174 start_codon:yes stop_codon:yes gene_type:complete